MIEDAILQAYNPNIIEVTDIILDIPSDTIYAGETLQLSATVVPDLATYNSGSHEVFLKVKLSNNSKAKTPWHKRNRIYSSFPE